MLISITSWPDRLTVTAGLLQTFSLEPDINYGIDSYTHTNHHGHYTSRNEYVDVDWIQDKIFKKIATYPPNV